MSIVASSCRNIGRTYLHYNGWSPTLTPTNLVRHLGAVPPDCPPGQQPDIHQSNASSDWSVREYLVCSHALPLYGHSQPIVNVETNGVSQSN